MSAATSPPPQPDAFGLSRRTTGPTEASREFVRLLAQIAVANYLREIEAQQQPTPCGEVPR